MKRAPVVSSNLAAVGYNARTRTLEVEFVGGAVYRYFDVPPDVHKALMAAESKGRFLNASIKGAYRYGPVVPEPPQPAPTKGNG